MTNALTTFDFHGTTIRVLDQKGEPWFLASEVCALLGYTNTRDAVLRHTSANQRNTVVVRDGNRGNPTKVIISEGGVNALILGSRLPAAQALKSWVTDVVLPTLRKDGMYVMGEEKVATGDSTVDELEAQLMQAA
ncbi:hypothetical protein TSH7_22830 [Azospirillum sp. TSH7]|uniref:BRO-N domain-containing protein n=1 Tax=unclassified Azospirillum TaxID=2630922 RepID=UPI000D610DE9|nr:MULTISPECIES: BRO family protein [unclassified Azospirillum]PWC58379.1 hypothetical protein TSH7_22830 [Azospirillum sp. TSH7]PWC70413.1 hypothetical protein TSH20_05685 [Azospirillum sp. TSH20]